MNLYQKPKTHLAKYKINEIVYFLTRDYEANYRAVASPFGILICNASTGEEEHILPSPKNEVLSVAFSPESNIIAGGKADNTIQLWANWNSYDGSHDKHILKGHGGSVTSVVFSPDCKILASGSKDGTIRLWEIVCKESRAHTSGEQEIVSISHKSTLEHSSVTSVVFSPDGNMLASGSKDGTIRLWESETRFGQNRRITILDPRTDVKSETAVTSATFSPNGSKLASGYNNGAIHLWNIKNLHNKSIVTLEKHTDSVQSLDFSSDGRTLASGSKDKTICIWDANAAEHLTILKKHTDIIFSVVFQSKQLVSESSDGTIRFWNTETGENEKTLVGGYIGNIESVVLSPDGQTLASIGKRGWDNTNIYLWDVNTGKIKNTIPTKVADFGSVYFTPDSQTFIGRSEDNQRYTNNKETIHLWDVNTGEMKKKIENLGPDRFSPDGRILIDSNGTFWDVNTGEQKASIKKKIESVRFSPDSKTFVTIETQKNEESYGYARSGVSSDKGIHLWDTNTGELKHSISNEKETFESVRFSPDSKTLVTIGTQEEVDRYGYTRPGVSSGKKISLWNIDTGERKHSISNEMSTFKSVRFSPDSKILVTIGTQKKEDPYVHSRSRESRGENINLWDIETGKQQCFIPDEEATFNLVRFSPDSKTLVGTTASKIYFFDIEIGKFRTTTPAKSISNVESIAFSRDSRLLLSISTNEINDTDDSDTKENKTSTFCFWDVEKGEPTPKLKEMTNNIESIVFNSDKTKFVSVHSDKLLRLWDVNTGKHQSTFEGAQEDIVSVAFSLDNRHLACASRNGMILLWEIRK